MPIFGRTEEPVIFDAGIQDGDIKAVNVFDLNCGVLFQEIPHLIKAGKFPARREGDRPRREVMEANGFDPEM